MRYIAPSLTTTVKMVPSPHELRGPATVAHDDRTNVNTQTHTNNLLLASCEAGSLPVANGTPSNVAINRRKEKLARLGWWWVLASRLRTSLTVAILFYIDGKPLAHWKFRIEPNSLVAVFSTITKSALLYHLAECIGQLKWHYFENTKALRHIEEFDRASRGPRERQRLS